MSGARDIQGPVLVLAPVAGDAEAVNHVLAGGGFIVRTCEHVGLFTSELIQEASVIVVAEEALTISAGAAQQLAGVLAQQPDWSDLPVILLAGQGANEDTAWALARGLESVGNITILERPLRRSTLLNAVSVALRARARQHELRAHKEHLEEMVKERTAALGESLRQLQTKERLAALGTLAAGLGHDIANLVLPIRLRLDPLIRECSTEQGREDLGAIGTALNYLTNLSSGLRLMALDPTREAASKGVDDVSVWWAQSQGVLRGVLPMNVRLEGQLPSGVGVRLPAHRLTQAVFNLVQNAGEALADRTDGVVRVHGERVAGGDEPGMVRLRVCDNGPGMPADVVSRCFEPYFSTKGRAIATGMGLSMVRGVAESAGGAVEVESEPGRGTTFTLTLPAVDSRRVSAGVLEIAAPVRTAGLSVTEPRIRAIAAVLLEGLQLEVVRPSGSAPAECQLWIAQDPPNAWVEDYLLRCPGGYVVVLQSESSKADMDTWEGNHLRGQNVTVLPLSVQPSLLREVLATAVRDEAVVVRARTP